MRPGHYRLGWAAPSHPPESPYDLIRLCSRLFVSLALLRPFTAFWSSSSPKWRTDLWCRFGQRYFTRHVPSTLFFPLLPLSTGSSSCPRPPFFFQLTHLLVIFPFEILDPGLFHYVPCFNSQSLIRHICLQSPTVDKKTIPHQPSIRLLDRGLDPITPSGPSLPASFN